MIDPTVSYAFVDTNEKQQYIHGHQVIDCGAWNGTVAYARYNGVVYDGEEWIATASNTNVAPPTDYLSWSVLVALDENTPDPTGVDAYARAMAANAQFTADAALTLAATGTNMVIEEAGSRIATDTYILTLIGSTAGSITADNVTYGRNSFTTVGAALDSLFYVYPSVTSFTNDVGTVETGSSVSSVNLAWAFNKTIVSQSINQGVGALPAAQRAATVSGPFVSSTTFTLTASDDHASSCNGNTTVSFMQKRYWGTNSAASLSDAQIRALSSEFSSSRTQTRTISPSAEYIYFAYPASFGAASFTVNGLPNTDWTLVTRAFVNASGYSESYRIYRSNNVLTGTYQVTIS
jgi:hypothetical protein